MLILLCNNKIHLFHLHVSEAGLFLHHLCIVSLDLFPSHHALRWVKALLNLFFMYT